MYNLKIFIVYFLFTFATLLACQAKSYQKPLIDTKSIVNSTYAKIQEHHILKKLQKNPSSDMHLFLMQIRNHLLNKVTNFTIPKELDNKFDSKISYIYITLFQKGQKPIRWGSKKKDISSTLKRIILKLKTNKIFSKFNISDPTQCRIMFEMVTSEQKILFKNLLNGDIKTQFEPGIIGFKVKYNNKTRYIMPNDAIVQSILSLRQMLNYISKRIGISKQTNNISKRIVLLRDKKIKYYFIKTLSYISYQNDALVLYRGRPIPKVSKDTLLKSSMKGIDWIVKNMQKDGSFLYFYDPTKDSTVDFLHPRVKNPLYYNLIRHNCGTLALLDGYELTHEKIYLDYAKRSIDYFITMLKERTYKGKKALYPFLNKKSKLGAAGTGLIAMMKYYKFTSDETYREQIDALVRHILSQITDDGEISGYYIHPRFNNGKPIINPSNEMKQNLFAHYYTGEALLGIAYYIKNIKNINIKLKNKILAKSKKALNFIVNIRHKKYQYRLPSLSMDAWIMQAIEQFIDIKGFNQRKYINFSYNAANNMIKHMYTENNSKYPDYIGGFFYTYGDHVYQDASRGEGLMSAYTTALKVKDIKKADFYMSSLLRISYGIMYTKHTEKSAYSFKYPEKVIDTFSFKLTRSWVRIDSVQHATSFLIRLFSACQSHDFNE